MGLRSRRQEHRTTTDPLGRRTAYQTASENQTDWPGHQKKRAATNKVDFKAAIKDGWSRSQEASLEKRHRCVQLPYFREAPSEVPLSTSPEPTISIQPASDLVSHTYLSPLPFTGRSTYPATHFPPHCLGMAVADLSTVQHGTCPASPSITCGRGVGREDPSLPSKSPVGEQAKIVGYLFHCLHEPTRASLRKCEVCRVPLLGLSKQLACLTVPTPSMHSRCDITGCELFLPSPKDGPSLSPSFLSLSQLAAGSRIAAISSCYFVW